MVCEGNLHVRVQTSCLPGCLPACLPASSSSPLGDAGAFRRSPSYFGKGSRSSVQDSRQMTTTTGWHTCARGRRTRRKKKGPAAENKNQNKSQGELLSEESTSLCERRPLKADDGSLGSRRRPGPGCSLSYTSTMCGIPDAMPPSDGENEPEVRGRKRPLPPPAPPFFFTFGNARMCSRSQKQLIAVKK